MAKTKTVAKSGTRMTLRITLLLTLLVFAATAAGLAAWQNGSLNGVALALGIGNPKPYPRPTPHPGPKPTPQPPTPPSPTPPPTPPPTSSPFGFCVTGTVRGEDDGMRTTKKDCLARDEDSNSATTWYAFCPDAGKTQRHSCSCEHDTIVKSTKLTNAISNRDSLINSINDGNMSSGDRESMKAFDVAVAMNCACAIYGAPDKPSKATTIVSMGSAIPVQDSTTGDQIKGRWELLSKYSKLMSKMNKRDSDKVCRIIPKEIPSGRCKVTESYDPDRSNRTSAHVTGLAVDIYCGDPESKGYERCTGNTQKLLEKIRSNNTDFNIIEECNPIQRDCSGTSGGQVIHLDLKDRGADFGGCYITNVGSCNWRCQPRPY